MPAVSCAPAAGVRRRLRHGGQRHHHQGRHDEEVGGGVAGEDPGRADQGVQQAADDGADDPGGVHLGRVQRDGARQVLLAHQPGQDGRVGRPEHGAAGAHPEHHDARAGRARGGGRPPPGPPRARTPAARSTRTMRKRLRSTLSARRPPTIGQDQGGAQLGEDDDADERGRVREVVGVRAEDDVLHPGADVRGEGAQEDDAEGPVRQRRPRRAGPGRERGCRRRRRRPRSPRWRWRQPLDQPLPPRPGLVGRRTRAAPAHGTGGRRRPPRGSGAARRSRCSRTGCRRPRPGRRARSARRPPRRCVVPGRCRPTMFGSWAAVGKRCGVSDVVMVTRSRQPAGSSAMVGKIAMSCAGDLAGHDRLLGGLR